ncbi:MAG: type transport system ATP-binding protein [Thermoleophilaceae bacterium]|nr:type transport system ATP-binding protein [Thermoleophilaceae bacterium]
MPPDGRFPQRAGTKRPAHPRGAESKLRRVRRGIARIALAITVGSLLALCAAAPASADLTSLKAACQARDAADGDTTNGVTLPFRFCDDGVPPTGGRTANVGAIGAVAVPQKYDGFAGLPPKIAPDPNAGADPNGDIALDIDVSMPDPVKFPPPPGGYPLVAMMHGCCAGDKTGWESATVDGVNERWHQTNAWYAARGYVVLNYTSRGFVNGQGQGSTGEAQLDSRMYEVNDFQHLAGQLADDPFFHVDPTRVVATGGSYGAGFTWMAYTDPTWKSPAGKDMRLVAAAPKYGWTDLVYALIPNGHHYDGTLPATDPADAAVPFGIPKSSIDSALFVSGATGVPSQSTPFPPHTTFPQSIFQALACLQSGDPFDNNPACTAAVEEVVPSFYADRSAYYQNQFFERLASDPSARVPVFSAGTFTDQLFTSIEHRRMVERIKSIVPDYPVQEFYGDYNHFVQNKPKEWGDVCGSDHHVCRFADYPGGDLNAVPAGRVLTGVTSRLNAFVDHYVKPQANPAQPKPAFDVTGSLETCPQNADAAHPADEPGERFTAPTFEQLAPNTLTIGSQGAQATANASSDSHALNSDPVANSVSNGGRCPVETAPPGGAVAVYDSDLLPSDFTMLGAALVRVTHTGSGQGAQLNARLYDVLPDGTQVLADRTIYRVTDLNGTSVIPLHGAGWRFPKGHRVRIELTQNDAPYARASNQPSSLLISAMQLEIPVREASTGLGAVAAGTGPPTVDLTAPRLASDTSRDPRFRLTLRGSASADHYELEARNIRSSKWSRLSSTLRAPVYSFAGYFGSAYSFRARAVGKFGQRGAWDTASTVVPFDDSRRRGKPSFGTGWAHVHFASAWGQRLSRATGAGRTMTVSFRGAGKLYLIARTSPSSGRAVLTIDGHGRRTVNLRSTRARNRALVAIVRAKGSGRHVLRLVTLGGGPVEIDGVGVATR